MELLLFLKAGQKYLYRTAAKLRLLSVGISWLCSRSDHDPRMSEKDQQQYFLLPDRLVAGHYQCESSLFSLVALARKRWKLCSGLVLLDEFGNIEKFLIC